MPEKGKQIRIKLFLYNLTQVWLLRMLEDNGIRSNASELSKVLSGKRTGRKADLILKTSMEIFKKHNMA